tara:strand:+ start:74 stop:364 length:291 start_codon:yes stop_codon:yes gene_type:complete
MAQRDADHDIDPIRDETRAGAEPDPAPDESTRYIVSGWFDGRPRVRNYATDHEWQASAEAGRWREDETAVRVAIVRLTFNGRGDKVREEIADDWIA